MLLPPTCNEVFSTSFTEANEGGGAEWIHGFSFARKSTASIKTSGKRQGWGTGDAMSVVSAPFAKSLMSQGDSSCQPKQRGGAAQVCTEALTLCALKKEKERDY